VKTLIPKHKYGDFMRALIDHRLAELRAELESGRRLQVELDARTDDLRRSMLRISGAIQVLTELAAADDERTSSSRSDDPGIDAPAPLRRVADR
jgi:hypothetical protein